MEFVKKWRFTIALVGLVLLGLVYAFWPEAVPVDVGVVDRGTLEIGVTDDGVTRIRDVYTISAPMTGRIARIEIEPGDTVIAYETEIARIMPRPPSLLDTRTRTQLENALKAARAAENMAQADMERAQAAQTLAVKTHNRAKELLRDGFATQARLDEAQTTLKERRAAAQMASAALQQRSYQAALAEAALREDDEGAGDNPIIVKAPTGGQVLQVLRESEAVVTEGTALVEIGDPMKIEIVADLLSREAVKIKPGDRVRLTRWGGPPLKGTVHLVEPFGFLKISALGIEEQRVNVIIDPAPYDGEDVRLGHGYQLDATVIIWSDLDALRLPLGAAFRRGDNWYAYRLNAGRAELVQLRLGRINDTHAQVLDGLVAGDQVVLDPSDQVTDGGRARARL